jgi:SAM-dependent methyltransferase
VSSATSQFYTGIVAELYDPLASYRPTADEYIPFLDRSGTPALELCCGSGRPLVELRARGYDVEGLDASLEMLERCRARAAESGIEVTLHHAEMQSFSLPRRYRSIFLAGGSFIVLTSDAEARRALACIHAHLSTGGSVLIPMESPDAARDRPASTAGPVQTTAAGEQLRCSLVDQEFSDDGQTLRQRLRYERTRPGQAAEILERDLWTRRWTGDQFRALLQEAGFSRVSLRDPNGGPAGPGAPFFVALAQRKPE